MAKVKCELCGLEWDIIKRPHLAKHGYTREQYMEEFPLAKICSEEFSKGHSESGKIGGKKSVESGHLASVASKGGKVGGKIAGKIAVKSGQIVALGKVQGQKNVDSGHLENLRTPEHQSKAAKAAGQKNKDSGHISRLGEDVEAHKKTQQTNIKNGLWIDPSEKTDLQLYRQEVKNYTYQKANHSLIPLIETHFPGSGNDIDHEYSVYDGFKNRILPEIVGSYKNCRILPRVKNIRKRNKSSITLLELCDRYFGDISLNKEQKR